MVGESVKEHVRRLRLERAAQRLELTERGNFSYRLHETSIV